ncbi:MAG: endonuclease/exonuclease/phosphatase family protein [Planctomycetaceae bacterium]
MGAATLGALGGAYGWPLELLSHFRIQYAAALLILAGAFLRLRAKWWGGAATALLALNGWVVAPFVLPIGATVDRAIDPGAPSWKLVSINVYSGNPTPERVLDYIAATDPDVVVLLEVTPEWEQRLTVLAARYPHSAVQARADNFGIALLTKNALHDVEFVPLSRENDAISARVELGNAELQIVAAHPFPPAGGRGAELRNRQLNELATHVARLGRPCAVAGDLNITPFSPHFDAFLAAAGLRDPRRGQGVLPTWPSQRWPLWIPIDHCVVSTGIAARLSVGPHVGSDHRPLLAELQLTASGSGKE